MRVGRHDRPPWVATVMMAAGITMVTWALSGCSASIGVGDGEADASSPHADGPAPDAGLAGGPADAARNGIDPSGGSGGDYPGLQLRDGYALYAPSSYDPTLPTPLVSVFHGQGGSAESIVDYWSAAAEGGGFLVLGITSSGMSGGWVLGPDGNRWVAALTDAEGAYNVERARHYLWGFSAGAHVAHWIVLQGDNADEFAAYAVNAGALGAAAGTEAPSGASRRVPVQLRVGASDPLLSHVRADRDRFVAAGWIEGDTLEYVEFIGGHVLVAADPEAIWSFFAPRIRP